MDKFKRLRFQTGKTLWKLTTEFYEEKGWEKKFGSEFFKKHIADDPSPGARSRLGDRTVPASTRSDFKDPKKREGSGPRADINSNRQVRRRVLADRDNRRTSRPGSYERRPPRDDDKPKTWTFDSEK